MEKESSDRSIIHDYLKGDRAANNQIEAYIAGALSVWRNRFGAEYDEVISDIRFKIYDSLRQGDFEFKSKLNTYIAKIVNNTCIDHKRYNKKFADAPIEDFPLADKVANQEEALNKKQEAKMRFRVLRQLPRECIQLWRMTLYSKLNCLEIGRIMGKSEGNIRRKLWACRQSAKAIRKIMLKKDKPF